MRNLLKGIVAFGLLCSSQATLAAPLTVPNTFTANTPALAADVNANFSATEVSVNDIETRLATLEAADLETRLAALEAVTDTDIAASTLQKMAGSWGMIVNSLGGIIPGPNTVEVFRETVFATTTILAAGTFSSSAFSGIDITTAMNVDGTSNPGVFTQSGSINDSPAVGSIAGTITIGANNAVTFIASGGITLNGFVSQNGQMIVLEGHDTATVDDKVNVLITMIKIQ